MQVGIANEMYVIHLPVAAMIGDECSVEYNEIAESLNSNTRHGQKPGKVQLAIRLQMR